MSSSLGDAATAAAAPAPVAAAAGVSAPSSASATSASASPSAVRFPNFCSGDPSRGESPDVVNWISDHKPDSREVVQQSEVPNRVYSEEAEVASRERLIAQDAEAVAAAADHHSGDEGPGLEEDTTIEYSRTLVCNAPRALLWRTLLSKVRHPERFMCNVRNAKITCEGEDFVFREMWVGPKEQEACIREKITWDEASESICSSLYEDEQKEGFIENAISLDASAHLCLTLSLKWTFHPHPDLTASVLTLWRTALRKGIDMGCAATVRAVEDEAKALAQERRRRHSLSASRDNELEQAMEQAAIDHSKLKVDPAAVAKPVTSSPGSAVRHVQVGK